MTDYLHRRKTERAGDRWRAGVVPELHGMRWYESFLHNDRARSLRAAVLALRDPHIVVIRMPWHLDDFPPVALLGASPHER